MPIRILNWNIERLSNNKATIAGMVGALSQVIVDMRPDIVIIVELAAGTGLAALAALEAAVTAASQAAGGAPTDYTGGLVSYDTGRERYGFLIRDLNMVRPVHVTAGPTGATGEYLQNLDQNTFATWPGPFAPMPNAYPAPAAGARPHLPLTELYAGVPPRGRKRKLFGGQTLASGGFAQGIGYRMPCLAMFNIRTLAANSYLLPIVVVHLAAVRGDSNPLGRRQITLFPYLHIAQKLTLNDDLPNGPFISLDGVATPVRNLMFTGDFNVNFLENALGGAPAGGNRAALQSITPTQQSGGSAKPAYVALPPTKQPGDVALPIGLPVEPRVTSEIPDLSLRAGVTTVGTILKRYDPTQAAPANMAALRGACFDNFFYNGQDLSAYATLLNANDAALTHDVPSQVVRVGPTAANNYDVGGLWAHYNGLGTRNAPIAQNLNPAAAPALTTNDRLIGARFLSDHLPSVIEFNLP